MLSRQTVQTETKYYPTLYSLLITSFELQGVYCCVGGDELLFEEEA